MNPQTTPQTIASGEVLRAIRGTLNLTIDDVASRTGIPKSSLHRYETGQSAVGNSRLLHLVSTYASELLARTEGDR